MLNALPRPVALLLLLAGLALLGACGSDEPAAPEPPATPAEFSERLNADLDDVIREMTTRIDALIAEGVKNPIPKAEVRQRTRLIAADAANGLSARFDLATQEAAAFGGEADFPAEREFLEGRTFLAVYSQQIRVEDALDVPLGLKDPLAD